MALLLLLLLLLLPPTFPLPADRAACAAARAAAFATPWAYACTWPACAAAWAACTACWAAAAASAADAAAEDTPEETAVAAGIGGMPTVPIRMPAEAPPIIWCMCNCSAWFWICYRMS